MLARIAVVATVLTKLSDGFPCVTQMTTDEGDWVTEECDTYCIIAFGKSTMIAPFLQPLKLCSGAGCAKLDNDGTLLFEGQRVDSESVTNLGNTDYPSDGEVFFFRCDNSTFVTNPISLEQENPSQPCNLYTRFEDTNQICKQLPDTLKVATVEVEAAFFEKNKFQLFTSFGIFAVLFTITALYLRWRSLRSPAVSDRADRRFQQRHNDNSVLGPQDGVVMSFNNPVANDDAADLDYLEADLDPEDRLLAQIPAKYAPGSKIYERYHMLLSEIYKSHGGNTDHVERVLHSYLSKPNGIETLNKKLKMKFRPEVEKIGKQLKTNVLSRPPIERGTQAIQF